MKNIINIEQFCERAQLGDEEAQASIVEAMYPIIKKHWKGKKFRDGDLDDVYQLQSIEILKAIPKYDPSKGATLFTYLNVVIKHGISKLPKRRPLRIEQDINDTFFSEKSGASYNLNLLTSPEEKWTKDITNTNRIEQIREFASSFKEMEQEILWWDCQLDGPLSKLAIKLGVTDGHCRVLKQRIFQKIRKKFPEFYN